jgi:HD-GYP domain-containing protein (c-di-GMP phosphodiesterase class II)
MIALLREAAGIQCCRADGTKGPLLLEKELEALTVQRGTLTDKERRAIERHVEYTGSLLSKMVFEGDYENVPSWAAMHHEMLNGSGYPGHLRGDQIPKEVRLITILDIYDALTEKRPYKKPMSPEKAFDILKDMCREGKLDRTILEEFKRSGAWKRD